MPTLPKKLPGHARHAARPSRRRAVMVATTAAAVVLGLVSVPGAAQGAPVRDVLVSYSADRSAAVPLDGVSLSRDRSVFVHAGVPDRWRLVKFWIDDPTMSGMPVTSDKVAPFDLVGNTSTGAALPLDLSGLAPGEHTVTARIKLATGVNATHNATFTVAAPSGTSSPSPTTTTSSPSPTSSPTPSSTPTTTTTTSSPSPTATTTTPAPTTTTAQPTSAPAPEGRPSAESAGVQSGVVLKPSGGLLIARDGAVVENLDVTGSITIQAHDVTLRNVRVRSNSTSYGINVGKGYSGTLIENVEVQVGVDGATANAAIGGLGDHGGVHGKAHGANVTVRNSELSGNGDGIKAANFSLYEGNYIRMRRAPGSIKHIDGIQSSGRSHWTARYNWVDQAYSGGHNAAIFAQAYTGTSNTYVTDIVIERNWVNGGVYTIQTGDGKNGETGFLSNIRINDNRFYRDYLYGVYMPRGGSGVSGNGGVWADTGAPVPKGSV